MITYTKGKDGAYTFGAYGDVTKALKALNYLGSSSIKAAFGELEYQIGIECARWKGENRELVTRAAGRILRRMRRSPVGKRIAEPPSV